MQALADELQYNVGKDDEVVTSMSEASSMTKAPMPWCFEASNPITTVVIFHSEGGGEDRGLVNTVTKSLCRLERLQIAVFLSSIKYPASASIR